MSGFRQVEVPREQLVLWEQRLDDAIPQEHRVRHLDFLLHSEPFLKTFRDWESEYVLVAGKPPYHPRDLSALYLYGMLHRIRSSRQLEAACYCRLDVIWLMQGQQPDHSTIASFVKQHGKHLRRLFRNVLEVMVRADLVKLDHVAVDGSKVEADAGKSSVRSAEKIRSWASHVEAQIEALEEEWAENERRETNLFGEENPWVAPKAENTKKELARLKRQQKRLEEALAQIERRQDEHVGSKPPKTIASTTDPDSRSMKDKEGRSKPNYNTQLAVDDTCGAIVAATVNDEADDSGQLAPMVDQVAQNGGSTPVAVSADSQYNTGPDLAAMEERGIDCYLPDAGQNSAARPTDQATQQALLRVQAGEELSEAEFAALPRNNKKMIDKSAFVHDKTQDQYRCPAGRLLVYIGTRRDEKKGGTAERRQYRNTQACAACPHATVCCPNSRNGRLVSRDQYEDHRERLRQRMATDQGRDIYRRRKHTVEPRIGHIKHNLGVRRFLRRGLEKVQTEWSLVCTAVNVGILLSHWSEVVKTL